MPAKRLVFLDFFDGTMSTYTYIKKVKDFHDKEMPEVVSNYICLAVIVIDFVLKKDENFYPQVFVKEYRYIEKR